MKAKYEIVAYKDHTGEFRWRIQSRNGRILADSGESYKRGATMVKTIKKIFGGPLFLVNQTVEGEETYEALGREVK